MEPRKIPYSKIIFAFIVLISLMAYRHFQFEKSGFPKSNIKILYGEVFGVEQYKITIITEDPEEKLASFHKNILEPFLKSFNQEFSTYVKDSYISNLNNAKLNAPMVTSQLFDEAFEESLWVNKETDGAFDPSIGPLINLWGFGEKKNDLKEVTEVAIKEAMSHCGLDAYQWQKGSILKKKNVSLNLSSVVEGFAVDLVGKLLDKEGYQNYLIDIGGENLARGSFVDGKPFIIGLEIPRDMNNSEDQKFDFKIKLINAAVASSGNYKQFYIKDGKRFSHIIDPSTGYPAQNNLACVTVIAKSCMRADTLSTAFMVMGFEKSFKYVNNHPEIDAIFTVRKNETELVSVMSVGFKKHVFKSEK